MISLLLAIAQLTATPTPAAINVPAEFGTLPSVEGMDDASICETMRGLATRVSPAQVDASSRLDHITVVCTIREVSFGQAVMPAEDDSAPGSALADAVCRNPAFHRIAERGWTLSTSLTAPDGRQAFRDIDCGGGS